MRRILRISYYNSQLNRSRHQEALKKANKIKIEELIKIYGLNYIVGHNSMSANRN
jgi:uncharacterized protein YaiL (DUF2058 family)